MSPIPERDSGIQLDAIDGDWIKRSRVRESGRPEEFEANVVEGYYSVELQADGSLTWAVDGRRPEGPVTTTPSPEDWQAFRVALDEADVWAWADTYQDPGVADGDYWGVAIRWDGRSVRSSGANAFPPGFLAFTRAVSRLVGGRTFR